MRIAQIAPLIESVPPKLCGGTERVVSWLTEELVAHGHQVTLFASGDSVTAAELVPCSEAALRLDPAVTNPIPYHMLLLDKVRERPIGALPPVLALDQRAVRRRFEERFTAARMAADYVKTYRAMLGKPAQRPREDKVIAMPRSRALGGGNGMRPHVD